MAYDGQQRRRNEVKAVVDLAAGADVRHAAADSGMAERTLFRRLRNPAFAEDIAATRAELIAAVVAEISGVMLGAVRVLNELTASDKPDQVRLRASAELLKHGLKLKQHVDLEARIDQLESRL